jgi:hypothetical protein
MKIGISVVEREASDAGRIVPSDIFSVGMVSRARRGPVGVPIPVYNVNDDKRIFGEFGSSYLGGYIRRGLFNNCREFGARVYNVRVEKNDAVTAQKTFNSGSNPAWTFKSGYLSMESPGADGNNTAIEIKQSLADPSKRDVLVYYKSPKDTGFVLRERFEELTNENVVDVINRRSQYVVVSLAPNAGIPTVEPMTPLVGGQDGSTPTDSDYTAALEKLNGLEVPMILNADLHAVASAQSLQTYVEGRGDAIGFISSPQGASIATLNSSYSTLKKSKSFLVAYRGWGKVDNENGGVISIPLLGHVIGAAWIRKAMERGGFPWVPPAGPSTALRDVVELEFPNYSDGEVDTLVKDIGFNPVQFVSGRGFVVRTSRMMSTTRKYYSAHVRRMTNFFISSFRNSFMWIEQEPNNETTRRRVSDALTFFAQEAYRNGAFNTRGGFNNNVMIKCDEENNTQEMIDAGQLQADFTFHPVEAVESGTINIFQTRDNLKVSDK